MDEFDHAIAPLRRSYHVVAAEALDEFLWSASEGEALLPWQALVRTWNHLEQHHKDALFDEAHHAANQVPDGADKLAAIEKLP